ncbi:MAG: hypothetical protein K9G27_08955 [Sphingomonadaceae bacterium]|jgi:hypothetical protein|nr:hypothetical protein [Sphingomonadaceae bacterium]
MTKEMTWGVVRAVLAAGGGYLVARGMIDAGTLETVLGALGTLFVAGWSIWSKK